MSSSREVKKSVTPIFMNSYQNLCRQQNTVPNPNIKIDNINNVLDFVGDRLKPEDWKPLLETISTDRSLHFINIKSRLSSVKVSQEPESDDKKQTVHSKTQFKSSSSFTNAISINISESISNCLSKSLSLTGLMLERIPLSPACLHNLTQGLEVCPNIQQLALPFTGIGDDGCATLCHVLRSRLNIVWLNLSGCGITDKGVTSLCNLLKFQKLNRYGESWKQSLRYRPVDPNIMPGLRRLTLNHNAIGDVGVMIFVETIIDDLWLKALDLQQCQVTMVGAEALLNLVRENQFLSVVDIRGNAQVPKSLIAAVVQLLAANNSGSKPEFQWLQEESKNARGSSSVSSIGSRSFKGLSLSSSESRLKQFSSSSSSQRMKAVSIPSFQRSAGLPNPASRATKSMSGTNCQLPKGVPKNISQGLKALSLMTVLPDKIRPPQSHSLAFPQNPRLRSNSMKQVNTTNSTPQPPWNCGSSLRKGSSDQFIRPRSGQVEGKRANQDILSQINCMKYILSSPT